MFCTASGDADPGPSRLRRAAIVLRYGEDLIVRVSRETTVRLRTVGRLLLAGIAVVRG